MAELEARESSLVFDKSFNALMSESLDGLQNTQISNVGPGGIANLIIAKANSHVANFYQTLKIQHAQAFLSMANGGNLDKIGFLLNCQRYMREDDENYRYRISKQTLSAEKANETALRLAILSVPEVKDVVLKEYSHGTGSFSAYPIIDDPFQWNGDLEARVLEQIKTTKSYGVKAFILQPKLVPVEIKGRLFMGKDVTEIDRTLLLNQATNYVRRYISVMKPGDTIQIHDLRNQILNLSSHIQEVQIHEFKIKNKSMLIVDQQSAWNERFTEASTPNAISFT